MSEKKMRELTPRETKLIKESIQKELSQVLPSGASLEDLVAVYRKRMGVPESHFPVTEMPTETIKVMTPKGEVKEALGIAGFKDIPGPLTIGNIRVGKGQGLETIVHELQHAKEMKARSKPEWIEEQKVRELKNQHFVSGEKGDPEGILWDVMNAADIGAEFTKRLEKMKK